MAAKPLESLGAAGNSLGAPPGFEGMGKKIPLEAQVSPGHTGKKGS